MLEDALKKIYNLASERSCNMAANPTLSEIKEILTAFAKKEEEKKVCICTYNFLGRIAQKDPHCKVHNPALHPDTVRLQKIRERAKEIGRTQGISHAIQKDIFIKDLAEGRE